MPRVLTDRQIEVLRLRCAGKKSAEVAAELGIALQTVWHHGYQTRLRLGTPVLAEQCRIAAEDIAEAETRARHDERAR